MGAIDRHGIRTAIERGCTHCGRANRRGRMKRGNTRFIRKNCRFHCHTHASPNMAHDSVRVISSGVDVQSK